MPMDSAAIAALNGQFQQGYSQQIAYAGMIGMGGRPWGGAPPPQVQGDQYAGMAMNRAAAIGAPALGLGLGLAGLDPMSLAMRGGMAGYAMGGIGGAAMGAVGFGLPAYAAWKGASYAGEQVYAGAQQQQMLNATLRSSFPFQNANGGQGFTGGQMAQIGTMMRGMTHQFGPAGEVVGFEEMTRLAGRMGQMGLSGVTHDVQDFSKKFRNMMDTLKTVAKEMGTSLEAAQEFMGSMRNSGLFQKADQLKFTTGARGIAAAGGLALSEVTGMASIGSQISRSIGGTGRQGVFAGMNTIGMVGSALQTGVLSEEDIYNATGLTGAEGRQAFAASQLEHSASFLKSQRGRRFLASMAGKNGTLNETNVTQWMNGGMGVGDTMRNANQNLHGMGRFNFLRNEGRLRGAVLERFGGLAMPMAYSSWLSERGYDPTNMDDKGMLAFQKYSGLGRDEADDAIKMVRELPNLMNAQQRGMELDQVNQRQAEYHKTHSVEGIKNRLSQAREKVNGTLQKIGQDLFSDTSSMVEKWLNELSNSYETTFSKEASDAYRDVTRGASASRVLSMISGPSAVLGRISKPNWEYLERSGMGARLRNGAGFDSTSQDIANFTKGGSDFWSMDYMLGGESQQSRYRRSGYSFMPGQDFRSRMGEVRRFSDVMTNMSGGGAPVVLQSGTANALQRSLAGIGTGTVFNAADMGQDRLNKFSLFVAESGDEGLKQQWQAARADKSERGLQRQAEIYASAVEQGGGTASLLNERSRFALPGSTGASLGRFRTTDERLEAYGNMLGGPREEAFGSKVWRATKTGAALGSVAGIGGAAMGATSGLVGGLLGAGYDEIWGGAGRRRDVQKAFAGLLDKQGSQLFGAVMSSDERTRLRQQRASVEILQNLQAKESELIRNDAHAQLSESDQALRNLHTTSLALGDIQKLMESGRPISDDDFKRVAAEYSKTGGFQLTAGQLKTAYAGGMQFSRQKSQEAIDTMASEAGQRGKLRFDRMRKGNMLSRSGNTFEMDMSELKKVSGNMQYAFMELGQATGAEVLAGEAKGTDRAGGHLVNMARHWENVTSALAGVSDKELAASLGQGQGVLDPQIAAEQARRRRTQQVRAAGSGKGVAGVMLGLGKDAFKGVDITGKAGIDNMEGALVDAMGLKSDDNVKAAREIASQLVVAERGLNTDGSKMSKEDRDRQLKEASAKLEVLNQGEEATDARRRRLSDAAAETDPVVAALKDLPKAFASAMQKTPLNVTISKDPEGSPKTDKVSLNCLAGETTVTTIAGLVPIQELSGKDVLIPVHDTYELCSFKLYGTEALWEVILSDGQIFYATAGHPWLLSDGSHLFTKELEGKELPSVDGTVSVLEVRATDRIEPVFCGESLSHMLTIGNGVYTGCA